MADRRLEDRLVLRRVEPARREEALAVLLLGKPHSHDPAVAQFRQFAREHRLSLDDLWAAYPARRGGVDGFAPLATALLVPSAGRTAMTFLSPVHDPAAADAAVHVAQAACAAQDPQRVQLAQAILDPWQEAERRVLMAAGFRDLATLIYMRRDTRPSRRDPLGGLDPAIDIQAWSDEARPAFEAAILASYEQTLDCPGLVGLRRMEDILAGHMASGRFDPRLWHVLMCRQEPVAVLLVSLVPHLRSAELVYLGLSPPWRRRGLGRRLVEKALDLAHGQDASSLMLAVDERNAPAVRLYSSARFASYARKRAMIRTLAHL